MLGSTGDTECSFPGPLSEGSVWPGSLGLLIGGVPRGCVRSKAFVTGHSGKGARQSRVLMEAWGVLPHCPDFPVLTHLTNLGSSTLWVFGLLGHGSSP